MSASPPEFSSKTARNADARRTTLYSLRAIITERTKKSICTSVCIVRFDVVNMAYTSDYMHITATGCIVHVTHRHTHTHTHRVMLTYTFTRIHTVALVYLYLHISRSEYAGCVRSTVYKRPFTTGIRWTIPPAQWLIHFSHTHTWNSCVHTTHMSRSHHRHHRRCRHEEDNVNIKSM